MNQFRVDSSVVCQPAGTSSKTLKKDYFCKVYEWIPRQQFVMKANVRDIIILNILVATFLFIGAGIFHVLESPNQYGQDHQFHEQINQATLHSLHKNLSISMPKNEFDNLVKNVYKLKISRPSRLSNSYNWSYSGSLYFSANVITTIGMYFL